MLDFSKGWTWFVAGLGATVVVTMILFAVAGLATWSERRRSGPARASFAEHHAHGLRKLRRSALAIQQRRWLMSAREGFTAEEARRIGEQIGIDWTGAPFDVEQFRRGMDVELEHGLHDSATNVTGDDPVVTGKIALAHLNEFPDYYTRLDRMEEEAKREHR